MSTRSFIGCRINRDAILAIYCHMDGYLSGVGHTLFHNYTSLDKVQQLMELGCISSLSDSLEDTISYIRDLKEHKAYNEPKKFRSINEFYEYGKQCGCEFFYLFLGAKWVRIFPPHSAELTESMVEKRPPWWWLRRA